MYLKKRTKDKTNDGDSEVNKRRGFVVQFSEIKEKIFEKQVGVTNAEGPPVPIPNTEVKLCSGEDTLRATVWENSSMLTRKAENGAGRKSETVLVFPKDKRRKSRSRNGGVAQLGEHLPCKQGVKSSNLFISTKVSGDENTRKTNRIGS